MNLIEDCTSFIKGKSEPIIVILGPTASGKTSLSLNIAKAINGEVISTDSRQIYREMPITTAVATKEEQDGVPHHLLEFRNPNQALSLGEYKDLATQKINEIYERGAIPILVGGTGLYISAIIEDYDIPRIPPNTLLREQLQREVEAHGSEFIHEKLERLDPESAKKIHPNNVPYIVRAIEINLFSGSKKIDKKSSKYSAFIIGIDWPREELYERINKRTDIMLKNGMLKEVQALLDRGYDEKLPSMTSVGVKEIIPYLKGEEALEQSLETLKRNTRRYAKRQMTWFRRYDNVKWITPDQLKNVVTR